ncbi:hypothetical protein [Parasitella parasitica]|uniref:Uncharacterized protein n=1 Tax=Parasitella parasitica TaxID=35722 RepID=A0A0B7N5N4_9FUNG|nr:hypothetical protein [Parasitella parasitica]
MQLFPKTLTNVKAAIHFGCLDLFDMFELRAQVSVTVFAEILNEINTARSQNGVTNTQFRENDGSDTVFRWVDSNFRADNGSDMKRDMAVNGVIAAVYVHGVVKKLVNVLQGERNSHSHTLAAIKSIVDEKEDLGDQRPLMISYSIMCRLKKRLCVFMPLAIRCIANVTSIFDI